MSKTRPSPSTNFVDLCSDSDLSFSDSDDSSLEIIDDPRNASESNGKLTNARVMGDLERKKRKIIDDGDGEEGNENDEHRSGENDEDYGDIDKGNDAIGRNALPNSAIGDDAVKRNRVRRNENGKFASSAIGNYPIGRNLIHAGGISGMKCPDCGKSFVSQGGWEYHTSQKVCTARKKRKEGNNVPRSPVKLTPKKPNTPRKRVEVTLMGGDANERCDATRSRGGEEDVRDEDGSEEGKDGSEEGEDGSEEGRDGIEEGEGDVVSGKRAQRTPSLTFHVGQSVSIPFPSKIRKAGREVEPLLYEAVVQNVYEGGYVDVVGRDGTWDAKMISVKKLVSGSDKSRKLSSTKTTKATETKKKSKPDVGDESSSSDEMDPEYDPNRCPGGGNYRDRPKGWNKWPKNKGKVGRSEERSDELRTLALGTKAVRAKRTEASELLDRNMAYNTEHPNYTLKDTLPDYTKSDSAAGAPTLSSAATPPNPLSALNGNRRKRDKSKKVFLSSNRNSSKPSQPKGTWVYDSELGGEVFIPAKTTTPIGKPTKKKTTPIKPPAPSSASSYPPANPNYTTWVPPLRNTAPRVPNRPTGEFDYSMQFNSYEDAAAEQERLFSDSKKRVEERKERERREEQKVRANVNSNRFVGKEVSFNYPCNIGNKKVSNPGPTLPTDHWRYRSLFGRLGLPENSSKVLVRKHYKKLALMYHPDKCRGDTEGGERFQRVKEAYELLKD